MVSFTTSVAGADYSKPQGDGVAFLFIAVPFQIVYNVVIVQDNDQTLLGMISLDIGSYVRQNDGFGYLNQCHQILELHVRLGYVLIQLHDQRMHS